MQKFIGTTISFAVAMTLGEYNNRQGWQLQEGQDPEEEGYMGEYTYGAKSNHKDNKYTSWSPKEQFEGVYQESGSMSFGHAIEMLKAGHKVARSGWNGKDMWLILTPGRTVENLEPNSFYDKCGFKAPVKITGHIDMKAADGSMVVGWLASQTDILANDWAIVE